MISAHPPISNSPSPLTKLLGIVLSVLNTSSITVTFSFQSIFNSLAKVQVIVSLFVFFDLHSVVCWADSNLVIQPDAIRTNQNMSCRMRHIRFSGISRYQQISRSCKCKKKKKKKKKRLQWVIDNNNTNNHFFQCLHFWLLLKCSMFPQC